MTISQLPAPPQANDSPADFNSKAFTFLGALPQFAQEANATAGEARQAADEAEASAQKADSAVNAGAQQAQGLIDAAAQQAQAAQGYAVNASGFAQQAREIAELYSGAANWQPGTAYSAGAVVWAALGNAWRLFRSTLAVSGNTPPENDSAHWELVGVLADTDPTGGPSSMTLLRDGAGNLTGMDFVQNGSAGSVTLVQDGGQLAQVITAYRGRTRTETLNYDANGTLTGVTADVV